MSVPVCLVRCSEWVQVEGEAGRTSDWPGLVRGSREEEVSWSGLEVGWAEGREGGAGGWET